MKSDAERLFFQDVHSKKKTGAGVFSRAGKGKKHTFKGGMRLPYDQLSNKEKKEYIKPSEVRSYNMNDVLPLEEFKKRSEQEQKELLERWRGLYKNKDICEKMGMREGPYYALLQKLNVPRELKRYKQSVIPLSLLQTYKDNVPDYETFMRIEMKQQFYLMWGVYEKRYKKQRTKLAEALGASKAKVYVLRDKLRKWAEKNRLEIDQVVREIEEETKRQAMSAVISSAGSEVAATTIEAVEEVVESGEKNDATPHGLSENSHAIELSGTYCGDVLSKRLKKIADFLANEGNQFEIQLTLKEIPNSAGVDEKEEILKKVLGLLMDK
ncbi:hypothetical protein NSQ26_14035 [Bacillus sp. FSL W7-1360]